MTKLLLLPLLAASVLALLLVSREGAPAAQPGSGWPVPHVIEYGDSITLPDGQVLSFEDVVEDSRCPADAMCAWQGRVIVALALDGERFEVEFLRPDATSVTVGGVVVDLRDVQPYPLASQPADVEDYEVTVRVSQAR